MSIWAKMVAGGVLLALLGAGLAFWMDLYGIRRGCLASSLDQARFESARDLYDQANRAVASRNYAAANDMLDLALNRLGDSYQPGRAEDETGELLTAAKAAKARSEFQVAARVKLEAMGRRVSLFQRKTRLAGLCRKVFQHWGLT
ncbi:MAG TPA: hypothetical protein VH189_08625 [Rhizomicrobium sp.]|nr:hypothetical protein [Rhizomicrobium sp.]